MIQLNLLPDVKQKFIKTRRQRRLISLICFISGSSVLGLVLILFMTTNVWQSRTINKLTDSINEDLTTLQSIPDLSKILTVQEQLDGLDKLHNQKVASTRIYEYLPQILPLGVSISELNIDYETNEIEITGQTTSLEVVNKFVDTIKFTDYVIYEVDETSGEEINATGPSRAFSEVVLTAADKDSTKAEFTVKAKFDIRIFETTIDGIRTNKIRLNVPKIITTRSETEQPGVLFESPVVPEGTNE